MRESAATMSRESEISLSSRIEEIGELSAALRRMESKHEDLLCKLNMSERKEGDLKKDLDRMVKEKDDSMAHFNR